ncbi:MAG: hypothetical protein ACE5HE_06830 [Phycisphaerae bacterium]
METAQVVEEQFGHIDWEEGFPFVQQALQRIWERNGWTSEADLAARDIACEVGAIPPWQIMNRFDLLSRRVGERYGFSDAQAGLFREELVREASAWLSRHVGTIFQQIRQGLPVDMRTGAIDREQVAHWAKTSEPLMADVRRAFDRVVAKMRPTLTEKQRAIMARDLHAFNRRWEDVQTMRARWSAGRWRPEDWGIPGGKDHDNRSAGSVRQPTPGDAGAGETPHAPPEFVIPRWLPHDPSTWFAYVMDTARRFSFNRGEMSTAWSVHSELVDRGNTYILTHAEQVKAVPNSDRSTSEVYAPVRTLFQELKDRLEAIPTTAQRAAVVP